jgi:two-component system nitrate/nitrite response regulator NarL
MKIMPSTMSNKIRVMLVDDHAVLRMGLQMLIESQGRMEIVAEAGDCVEALAKAGEKQPDIILLDLDLGGVDGLEIIQQLLQISEKSQIIILTGIRETETHERAVRLGARGVVLKDKADEQLIPAIEKVKAGELWLSRIMIGRVFADLVRGEPTGNLSPEAESVSRLTERERQVIALVADGLKNKEIGNRLFISEATVRHHLTSIFAKLNVNSRLELVIYSYRHGIVKSPI